MQEDWAGSQYIGRFFSVYECWESSSLATLDFYDDSPTHFYDDSPTHDIPANNGPKPSKFESERWRCTTTH